MMKKLIAIAICLSLGLLFAGTTDAAVNLLENPSFESQDSFDPNNPDGGWEASYNLGNWAQSFATASDGVVSAICYNDGGN